MNRVAAVGAWYTEYAREAEPALADLAEETRAACRQPVRRIDRFIQLALIGSSQCVGGRPLPAETGIYLASGSGPVSSTAAVHDQMFQQGLLPKPAQFINTLANTAGFYVARNLEVEGQCLFVSSGTAAFEAALELAAVDLALGKLDAALVGMVEECVWPLEEHVHRLRREDAAVVAEGSLWLLLEADPAMRCSQGPDSGDALLAGCGQGNVEAVTVLSGIAALEQWLRAQPESAWCWHHPELDSVATSSLRAAVERNDWKEWPGPAGESPLRAAVVAAAFLTERTGGVLITVNSGRPGLYHVCRYRAAG